MPKAGVRDFSARPCSKKKLRIKRIKRMASAYNCYELHELGIGGHAKARPYNMDAQEKASHIGTLAWG